MKDGRYHYIETGSLISIKKNVKNILIPSEEMKIQVYPMDYEEFCAATGNSYSLLEKIYGMKKGVGQQVNRKLMRDIRIYMAVGGMPQAVESYVNGDNFSMIDQVKRQIIKLYEEDFKKLDPSGKLSAIYHSIPAQLSKDLDSYKLYIADTGLFITLMFIDRPVAENEIYAKLLSDKLPANLGYLYENLIAQMITASGRELYYYTWEKEESTHYYEIDFLISQGAKVSAIEVKSSGTGKHESLTEFSKKYWKHIKESYILSQKDIGEEGAIKYIPIYLTSFLCKYHI